MALAPRERSYRALLHVPGFPRVALSMGLARISQQMVGVAMVLFVLTTYRSAPLAGLVSFLSLFPGILVSPLAGALLDRHGRTRLVLLDYAVACASLLLIGGLAWRHALPIWLLLLITAVSSLTYPLSNTGLRTLFPLLAPRHLWERANAVDSSAYVVATLLGPPVAGALVGLVGGPLTLIGIGAVFATACFVVAGLREPLSDVSSTGNLLRDAWQGVVYTARNPTLRGLALALSTLNFGGGIAIIALPFLLVVRLHQAPAVVGLCFALQGACGVVATALAGRIDSRGRERAMMLLPTLAMASAFLLVAAVPGVWMVALAFSIVGLANGPYDIALFTLRQRRTDPLWMGRAFAVSMAFNFSGVPLGSAAAGPLLAAFPIWLPLAVGAAVSCVSAALVLAIPKRAREFGESAPLDSEVGIDELKEGQTLG